MAKINPEKESFILKKLKNIEYGSLVITLHAGQITQIDSTEKIRLQPTKHQVKK